MPKINKKTREITITRKDIDSYNEQQDELNTVAKELDAVYEDLAETNAQINAEQNEVDSAVAEELNRH